MQATILDQIGNTPLVEIRHLNPNPAVRILVKLEYFNPGGSIKDRAALAMIEAGERSGDLTPGKTVIEATSGNTGIGLALVCSVKKYPLLLAMSEAASIERQKILKARGAKILLTPGHLGTDGAIEEVYRLALEKPDRYFMADQYNNPANWQAHYNGTAVEIWEQTAGRVSMVVATLGTSGTLMGLSRRFKAYDPKIRIVGVEPYLGHKIQGLKNMKEAYRPEIFEKHRLDEKVNVEDEDAFEMTRQLARTEGLFVGMSSGAAVVAACRQAEVLDGGTIVVILPDSGERYLSTPLFHVQEKTGLKLFNTLTRRKENFNPITPGKVSLYSCGPTAHAPMHAGEWRRMVFSDLLCRYLRYRGFAVEHVMNITDLDDKTIDGSEKAGIGLAEFTQGHIDGIMADLARLGVSPADHYPRASEHVDAMIELAGVLVKKGVAYEKMRSLYFDISRLSTYGQLSGIDLNKIRLGATVDLDDYEKDNPRDFTLLKRARLSEMKRGLFTPTEWGNVRPSWHIQCAGISMKYFKSPFDIHAAGRELVFPHHENENAIALAATGNPLARYWIHCDRVLMDGKKADGPSVRPTLSDLTDLGFAGREIRYWLLASHYRKPVAFSEERLLYARSALKRLDACVTTLQKLPAGKGAGAELDQLLYDLKSGFVSAMDDDLNTSAALASIFGRIKRINTLAHSGGLDATDGERLLDVFGQFDGVLHIFDFSRPGPDDEIEAMLKARDQARAGKDWAEADRIRGVLRERGVEVQDRKI
jgi:cysteinyl-tRNA synthetase